MKRPPGCPWVLLNGSLAAAARARSPVDLDAWLQPALVESLPVRRGRPAELAAHLARLAEGARALAWPVAVLEGLGPQLKALVRRNRLLRGGLRLRQWRDGRRLAFCVPARPVKKPGLRLITTPTRHFGAEPISGRLKTNAMLTNWMARAEALAWAEDGLRLTPAGLVAEGVWSNIVIRKGRRLLTPPLHHGILEGVTRSRMLSRYRRRGFEVAEAPLTRYDLYTADQVWVCASMAGPLEVVEVDARPVYTRFSS